MQIISGKMHTALKTVIYGPEGIGKSTFAAQYPNPLFIDTEGSTKYMDVDRTPPPSSWAMLTEQVKWVRDTPHNFKTLVIDTADWAEQMCSEAICDKNQKTGIEDFGYGRGYTYLQEDMGKLLNLLEEVIHQGINVTITAHAKMRKFEQPDEMGAYDRWELKLQKTVAPLLKEWADIVLFANYKTTVVNVDGQGALKGKNKVQGGKRVMYTTHHPCWDAKNRFGLPEEMPFDYNELSKYIPAISGVKNNAAFGTAPKTSPSTPSTTHIPSTLSPESSTTNSSPEPVNEVPMQQEAVEETVKEVPKHLKKLYQLMEAKGVTAEDVQKVVAERGYFPADMPLETYPQDFIEGVLVGAWDQVYQMIEASFNVPF